MTLIGFDGGGSVSRFLIERTGSQPEYMLVEESLKYSDLGIEPAATHFRRVLEECGVDLGDIGAIAIGLSGAGDPDDQAAFRAALGNALGNSDLPIHVESDSSLTLKAAYPEADQSGLLVIAGTGSVYLAKTTDGEVEKIGGWGRMLGDEGSGYWLGLHALRHYCKVLDNMEPQGTLFDAVSEEIEAFTGGDRTTLRSILYSGELKPATFAPLVFEMIASDEVAHMIALEATNHLARHIEALCERVADRCDSNIHIHGGLFNSTFFQASLAEQVASYDLHWSRLDEQAPVSLALAIAKNLAAG